MRAESQINHPFGNGLTSPKSPQISGINRFQMGGLLLLYRHYPVLDDWRSLLDVKAAKSEEAISTLALPTDSQHCQGLWGLYVLRQRSPITGVNARKTTDRYRMIQIQIQIQNDIDLYCIYLYISIYIYIYIYLRIICKAMEGNCLVILRFNNACAIPMPPHPLKILLISRYLRHPQILSHFSILQCFQSDSWDFTVIIEALDAWTCKASPGPCHGA